MHKNKALIAPLGLVGITILSGVFLMSSYSDATSDNTDVVDDVSITVPVSCSLSGTGMTSHTATIENGRYVSDIGTTTLKAFCNDANGFAIYANGYTGDTLGNNKLIGSSTSSEIVTGTATTAGSPDVSNWAMKLETSSSATYALTLDNGFGNYSNVPSSYTKVAHRDSNTDLGTSAEGATLTSTYAAYIAKTQPADSYQGQVIYTLVHPASVEPGQQEVGCEPGKICYQPNANSVQGQMSNQTAYNNERTSLWASNFSRAGYGFAGWNDKYDYSGTFYGPNQDTIQNWDGCSSLAQGSTTALTDERDGNTYAIAKLKDGKCWTIENLRLENTASHNTDGSFAQGYNSSFIGLANPEYANFYYGSTNANSLYSTNGVTDATIAGDYQGYRFPRYSNINTQYRQSNSNYSASNNTYSYGNYYTWHAVIADTTHYSTENQSIENTSLCPKGWRLPKGGSSSNATNSDFWNLGVSIMGFAPPNNYYYYSETNADGDTASKAFRKYPNNFVYSGSYDSSVATSRNLYGYYWSSTVRNQEYSYMLYLYYSSIDPGTDSYNKSIGYSIRCMLDS